MELVKLKMKFSYKLILFLIGLLIILSSLIGINYYLNKDNKEESGSDIEVDGVLSINYIDGKDFLVDDIKTLNFNITSSAKGTSYYTIGFSKIRGTGKYRILSDGVLVTDGELKSSDEIITDYISIDELETKDYMVEIINTSDNPLKGSLIIRSHEMASATFADLILKNNEIKLESITKVGSESATQNEGLIKSTDDMGISYYFRGNILNNYVLLNDIMFRIVRINGDGTVRLVLNDLTSDVSNYYSKETEDFEFSKSEIFNSLKEWFSDNLQDYENIIVNTKYCNDIKKSDDNTYYGYTRIVTNKIPTLNCLSDRVSENIGLMSVDEVVLAGASPGNINKDFYLYNEDISTSWYTMTGAKDSDDMINLFMVEKDGEITYDTDSTLFRGVRPVINLVKNVNMIGDGTKDNPYKLVKSD